MLRSKMLAKVMVIVLLVNLFAFFGEPGGGVSVLARRIPKWDQSIIDDATKVHPISLNVSIDYKWGSTLVTCQAMYILSLMSYYNPDLTDSSGRKVSDRLIDHIAKITTGGFEPSCRGSLGGWVDNPVAQALVLAKHTPAVWDKLTDEQKARCDFIMQCMTVVGNLTQNFKSRPKTDMSQSYEWQKGYNPNMQEGYVGIMIAAYFYFGGADNVNAMLADFSYDEYIAKMDEYGFKNVKLFFEIVGKRLMEDGGVDRLGGSLCSARTPFTFQGKDGELEYDPMAIYYALSQKMWDQPVTSKVYSGTELVGYIKDGSISPFEGQIGMGHEFSGRDAAGVRTSADYINLCIRNCIPTRATIEALGYWKGEYVEDIERRMYVGMEDYLFKISDEHGGWVGYDKGKSKGALTESHMIKKNQGHQFFIEIWRKMLKRQYSANGTFAVGGNYIDCKFSFLNIAEEDYDVKAIVAVYDEDGKLFAVNAKPFTVKKGTSEMSLRLAKPGNNPNVKMHIWSAQEGMQQNAVERVK